MSPDRLRDLDAAARELEGLAARVRRSVSPRPDPIVEIALVPAPDQLGPIVEVEIIPVTELRRLQQLKTLADIHAVPRAQPKRYTKLDRAIERKAARIADERLLKAWALAVKTRDQWKDRKTGARLRSTTDLDPLRAEAHHIVSRDDLNVRTDIRNGVCLSYATHFAVTHQQFRIEGTEFFVIDGQRYIDGTFPVFFVRL